MCVPELNFACVYRVHIIVESTLCSRMNADNEAVNRMLKKLCTVSDSSWNFHTIRVHTTENVQSEFGKSQKAL